jgi:GNAT superfamily N-acetyltransferase
MNPSPVTIRQARPADHVPIASLLRQLGYDPSPLLILQKIESALPSPIDIVFVAATAEDVVGCISLHALPLFHAPGHLGRITSMVVDERHRGCGIGSALIAEAEKWFAAIGCLKLEVTSADTRSHAHRFYERHGFTRDGQRLAKRPASEHRQIP